MLASAFKNKKKVAARRPNGFLDRNVVALTNRRSSSKMTLNFETFTNSIKDKLELKKCFVTYLDKAGLLVKLERGALEYKKCVEHESFKNDASVWIPSFRFVLPLDLLLIQSENCDKLLYLIVFEPEQAMQLARNTVLLAVKQISGVLGSKITESEIEVAMHLITVPGVIFYSPKASSPGGLLALRGILTAKSTAVKYARSSVYVCQTTCCTAFDLGERRRRPGPSEFCRNCYEPLQEQVRFRDVGEEIVCKFVPDSESTQTFKKYFSFTVTIKDELNLAVLLELGKVYNLIGKMESNSLVDVWHISDRSSCTKISKSHRCNFDNILLPPFISQMYFSMQNDCKNSPWAFVIAVSSLLGGNVVPCTSFLHLKMGLVLSLATQSSGETPMSVLGVGGDTSTAQVLFRAAGRLAERYVLYSADFAHLGGSIKRGTQAGAVWQEAGAMVLGIDGVCDLGDWSKLKRQQSDYVRSTLERGEIVFSNKDAEHNNLTHSVPLKCSVWSYFNGGTASQSTDSRLRLKTLADVFGMPYPIDETSESETDNICKKHLRNNPNVECDYPWGFEIPQEELKEYMMLVKKRSRLSIRDEASELIKNYFVANRKHRPGCLPVGAIKTITSLSEAHAKLALRTEVIYEDVIAVIYWYEEAATVLFGPTGYDFRPPPEETDKKPFYVTMDRRLRSFKQWLAGYLESFTANVPC